MATAFYTCLKRAGHREEELLLRRITPAGFVSQHLIMENTRLGIHINRNNAYSENVRKGRLDDDEYGSGEWCVKSVVGVSAENSWEPSFDVTL